MKPFQASRHIRLSVFDQHHQHHWIERFCTRSQYLDMFQWILCLNEVLGKSLMMHYYQKNEIYIIFYLLPRLSNSPILKLRMNIVNKQYFDCNEGLICPPSILSPSLCPKTFRLKDALGRTIGRNYLGYMAVKSCLAEMVSVESRSRIALVTVAS